MFYKPFCFWTRRCFPLEMWKIVLVYCTLSMKIEQSYPNRTTPRAVHHGWSYDSFSIEQIVLKGKKIVINYWTPSVWTTGSWRIWKANRHSPTVNNRTSRATSISLVRKKSFPGVFVIFRDMVNERGIIGQLIKDNQTCDRSRKLNRVSIKQTYELKLITFFILVYRVISV